MRTTTQDPTTQHPRPQQPSSSSTHAFVREGADVVIAHLPEEAAEEIEHTFQTNILAIFHLPNLQPSGTSRFSNLADDRHDQVACRIATDTARRQSVRMPPTTRLRRPACGPASSLAPASAGVCCASRSAS